MHANLASPTGGLGVGPGFGQGAGNKRIGRDELVSVDLCGCHGGYISDMTRLYFTGPIPALLNDIYGRLLDILDELLDFIRPGRTGGEIYDHSFQLAEKHGGATGFMNQAGPVCPFIGHGIGLELDEWPVLARGAKAPLAAGMTFALEPRIFAPDLGVVGIEDTYLLTESGQNRLP